MTDDNERWLEQRVAEMARQDSRRRTWSRPVIVAGIALFAVPLLVVGIYVTRNFLLDFSYRKVCPDYFAYQHAYVVGPDRQGIDSVAVTMWDNAKFNVMYRTFTDQTGRFTLFNDFFSFAVYECPMTYEIHVVYHGRADTVLYQFERYNVCHFRKTLGPDTILLDPGRIYEHVLDLRDRRSVEAHRAFPLTFDRALDLQKSPPGAALGVDAGQILYGRFSLGGTAIPLAVTHGPLPCRREVAAGGDESNSEASMPYRLFVDWDQDNDLSNEVPRAWRAHRQSDDGSVVWVVTDSIRVGGRAYQCLFAARGLQCSSPSVAVMRADAVQGTIRVGGSSYDLVLWDRQFTDYRELGDVRWGIDADQDGRIRTVAGSVEYYPALRSTASIDTFRLRVDTVAADGGAVYCTAISRGPWLDDASAGAVAPDLPVTTRTLADLDRLFAGAPLTALVFFDGDPRAALSNPAVTALASALRPRLGDLALVGIQRGGPDRAVEGALVIREGRGWDGPLVVRYRNTLPTEAVLVDRTGTIAARGPLGANLIHQACAHLRLNDAGSAVSAYHRAIDGARVIGEVAR